MGDHSMPKSQPRRRPGSYMRVRFEILHRPFRALYKYLWCIHAYLTPRFPSVFLCSAILDRVYTSIEDLFLGHILLFLSPKCYVDLQMHDTALMKLNSRPQGQCRLKVAGWPEPLSTWGPSPPLSHPVLLSLVPFLLPLLFDSVTRVICIMQTVSHFDCALCS